MTTKGGFKTKQVAKLRASESAQLRWVESLHCSLCSAHTACMYTCNVRTFLLLAVNQHHPKHLPSDLRLLLVLSTVLFLYYEHHAFSVFDSLIMGKQTLLILCWSSSAFNEPINISLTCTVRTFSFAFLSLFGFLT